MKRFEDYMKELELGCDKCGEPLSRENPACLHRAVYSPRPIAIEKMLNDLAEKLEEQDKKIEFIMENASQDYEIFTQNENYKVSRPSLKDLYKESIENSD